VANGWVTFSTTAFPWKRYVEISEVI
jgi:hypothetical protein